MRVIGIDPGLRNLGWGVIDTDGNRMSHVANGIIHGTDKAAGAGKRSAAGSVMGTNTGLAARLLALYEGLSAVVARFPPDAAAIEQTFVNRDGAGTLKLGQARGVALLVPAQAGLEIGEYAPNQIKKTVVGVGHADKRQVEHMVRLQLPGVELAGPDAADALAIALCHAHFSRAGGKLEAALRKASA